MFIVIFIENFLHVVLSADLALYSWSLTDINAMVSFPWTGTTSAVSTQGFLPPSLHSSHLPLSAYNFVLLSCFRSHKTENTQAHSHHKLRTF